MVALARESSVASRFEFRRVRRRRGAWRAWYPPLLKKRTALLRKLKEIFRWYQSDRAGRGADEPDPARLCGTLLSVMPVGAVVWSKTVEKKVRRHLRRARKRRGFGWKRWRRQWLYQRLGLCNNYRGQRPRQMPKALPA